MATTTAGALIVAGLRRADMVDSPTGYIQHPVSGGGEAFDLLNAALSELFDLLYEADSEAYGETMAPFSIVGGTPTFVLQTLATSSFYHLRAIEYFNGQRFQDLPRISFGDRNNFPTKGRPSGYSLEGANLTIYPTPDSTYQGQLWFIGLPPTTAADTDPLDLQGPWSEFVWKHFAKACLGKEESDTSELRLDLYGPDGNGTSPACLSSRIRNGAKKRDVAHPTAPRDVQDSSNSPFWEPWLYR